MPIRIPPAVKVISFDIWETLLKGNRAFSPVRLQIIKNQLQLTASPDNLLTAYRQADKYYNQLAEVDGINYGPTERLKMLLEAINEPARMPNASQLDKILNQIGHSRCLPAYAATLIEEDLLSTLKQLSGRGYHLALLSNTGFEESSAMRPLLQQLGILQLAECALFTSDLGIAKPNPLVFRKLASEMGVRTSSILHIGDNVNADYRAIEAGCRALVYAPNGSNLPHIRRMTDLLAE